MLVLGLLLVLVAVGVLAAVVVGGANDTATYDVGSLHVTMSTMAVFLIGVATVLVLLAGIELIRAGGRRARRRRRESKELSRLSEELKAREAAQAGTEDPTATRAIDTETEQQPGRHADPE